MQNGMQEILGTMFLDGHHPQIQFLGDMDQASQIPEREKSLEQI